MMRRDRMSYNVSSESKSQPQGWIWAECRRHEARYALLGDAELIVICRIEQYTDRNKEFALLPLQDYTK